MTDVGDSKKSKQPLAARSALVHQGTTIKSASHNAYVRVRGIDPRGPLAGSGGWTLTLLASRAQPSERHPT